MSASSPSTVAPRAPRVALVLGGGGIVGASYLVGVLDALHEVTGWGPRDASLFVGTSAGAFVGALDAVGIPSALTYAQVTQSPIAPGAFPGPLVDLSARMDAANEVPWNVRYRPPFESWRTRWPRPIVASPRLALRALDRRRGPRARLQSLAASLMGEGMLSNLPTVGEVIRTALPRGWPDRPFWTVALDLDRGERVAFGSPGAPRPDLHLATSASTAVPFLFAPVLIDGHRYADAGVLSPSNLDLVAGLGFDLVVCVNPLSGGEEPLPRGRALARAGAWAGRGLRRGVDALLAEERALVEASGSRVVVIHPSADEIADFPFNSMDPGSRPAVMRVARRVTRARLSRGGDLAPLASELAAIARSRRGGGASQAHDSR